MKHDCQSKDFVTRDWCKSTTRLALDLLHLRMTAYSVLSVPIESNDTKVFSASLISDCETL